MNTKTNKSKNTLSSQVKQILENKGYSFLFNWSDYHHFKDQAKTAFNRAFSIAEMFIQESTQKSDYNEYIY